MTDKGMTPPHELAFVLTVPEAGAVTEHAGFDLYVPTGADGPRPAVVFVPGPTPPAYTVRPTKWPQYTGYGQLLAGRGVVGAVVDMPYHDPADWAAVGEALPGIVESVRGRPEVDADRVAIWAFSGGALLVGRWFAESPAWLRCLALTYPMLADEAIETLRPGRPILLTQVGLERREVQDTVNRFLATAVRTGTDVRVISVPNGHHGFDIVDHTEESRHAVMAAADYVVQDLAR